MFLYLAISTTAVSATLIREEQRVQHPVYYVSQAFQGAEAKYPRMEKITFAMIVASWKLRPYFQVNSIIIMTNQSIKKEMNKPEATGWRIQWAIQLCQFDIEYKPRVAIKGQALADFIAEFTMPKDGENQEETIQWTDHWHKRGEEQVSSSLLLIVARQCYYQSRHYIFF